MKNNIKSILEQITLSAALEKLTPEQETKLTTDVMRAMLNDETIDPRTKQGIQMGFQRGIPPEMMRQAYQELAKALRDIDPSATKLYVNFILRNYAKGGIEFGEIMGDFPPYLKRYETMRQSKQAKPPYNDINVFKSLHEFKKYVDENSKALEEKESEAGTAKTVYEDATVKIIVPLDVAASCRYGKGTRWCTATTGSINPFDRYTQKGPLYYLLPKQPKYPREKYAIHFQTNAFRNELDKEVDDLELLSERFGNLIAKYFRDNQDYKNWANGEYSGITRLPVQLDNGMVFESFTNLFYKQKKK